MRTSRRLLIAQRGCAAKCTGRCSGRLDLAAAAPATADTKSELLSVCVRPLLSAQVAFAAKRRAVASSKLDLVRKYSARHVHVRAAYGPEHIDAVFYKLYRDETAADAPVLAACKSARRVRAALNAERVGAQQAGSLASRAPLPPVVGIRLPIDRLDNEACRAPRSHEDCYSSQDPTDWHRRTRPTGPSPLVYGGCE